MVVTLEKPLKATADSVVKFDEDKLRLEIKITTTLGITAEQAKRKVARFFMDEVSMFISPQSPILVIEDNETILWRCPMIFSMGSYGKLGSVGQIDVDAYDGKLLITDNLLEEIKANAHILRKGTTLSTTS